VRYLNLTDDDLWRGIAENTNAMSALVHHQLELVRGVCGPNDDVRVKQIRFNDQTIDGCHREYGDFASELRRRYP
jgi:hypothetical protein